MDAGPPRFDRGPLSAVLLLPQDTNLVLTDTALTTTARAKWPAATRFRDLALNRCHAFLPDQEGAGGWCCGRPVEGGDRFLAESYCAQHSVRFRVQARR
jgi:hypothetical protein